MLRALMRKVNNMLGQMANVCREMKIIWKNQNEMLEKNLKVAKKKNAFNGQISKHDIVEERISELEESSQITCKEKKRIKKIPPPPNPNVHWRMNG